MRQFKPDKLEVVLRPDSSTQISVQLHYVGNDIIASARCDQGDFAYLNAHWSDLQRTMDQQGIRLSPLRDSVMVAANLGGSAFGNSSQTPYDQRAARLEDAALSSFASNRVRSRKTSAAVESVASVSSNNLLQTWA
jgi:hypothetical protein